MSPATWWTLIVLALAVIAGLNDKVWWYRISAITMAIGVIFGHSVGVVVVYIMGILVPPLILLVWRLATRNAHQKDTKQSQTSSPPNPMKVPMNVPGDPWGS